MRDKLVAEMKAGMAIVKSPKPDRGMIDLLLIRPLKWIAEKAAGATIAAIASEAMKALLRWMTGGVG